jgi:CDP-diacylglycerol--glycerol-3-phosphate 3-phosphatidyltransferase
MKLKYIPNALSIVRGIMALSLIFIPPLSLACVIIFTVAGFTDMIDGNLARRIEGAKSELGATLDSVADLLMFIVAIFVIIPAMAIWPELRWIIISAISLKLMNIIPALIWHREVFFTHTIPSKMFTLSIFLTAVLYMVIHRLLLPEGILPNTTLATVFNASFVVLIVYAFAIIVEETYVIIRLKYPEKNIKGFWELKKVNDAFINRQKDNV